MPNILDLAGPECSLHFFGVRLMGLNAETGGRLLLTLLVVGAVLGGAVLLGVTVRSGLRFLGAPRIEFWARQGLRIFTAVFLLIGVASIWFDDPARLTTAFGLMTAGLAFALQQVITAFAGYIVILRGRTFNVGDRIMIGGVRGDVIALDFTQTTLMEMGEPPPSPEGDSGNWVQSRQFTGRIVRITNAKIFDEPIYNYTRDFPYLWEEISLPIPYRGDRRGAERILLAAATRHTVTTAEMGEAALASLQTRYFLKAAAVDPKVFYRLTDNWIVLTVRFLVRDHGNRETKDLISRDILDGLEEAGIDLASSTLEIVGLPPLRVETNTT